MEEEEAALLAELRAISNRSAVSRFDENDNENMDQQDAAIPRENEALGSGSSLSEKNTNARVSRDSHQTVKTSAPSRGGRHEPQNPTPLEGSVVLPASDGEIGGGGFKSNLPSTFQGDRGGPAEDEELLAELRAISAKSVSADRFSGGDEDDTFDNHDTPMVLEEKKVSSSPPRHASPSSPKPRPSNKSRELPPWKQAKSNAVSTSRSGGDFDVVVAASPASQQPSRNITGTNAPPSPGRSEAANGQLGGNNGFKSNSTFQGERGGAAEDEDLLAELRAISAKSGAADRFANGDEDDPPQMAEPPPAVIAPSERKPSQRSTQQASVPPWKRGRQNSAPKQDVDVVVAAPPPKAPQPLVGSNSGFKSSTPSTFQGDRGGAAEDEELLAELRAISAGSSSAARFQGDDETLDSAMTEDVQNQLPETKQSKKEELPPWKRGKQDKAQSKNHVDVVVEAPRGPEPFSNGFKPSIPSTFVGDRGGSAEDEELLAELRAISAKSSSAGRFKDEDAGDNAELPSSSEKPGIVEPSNGHDETPNLHKNARGKATPPWKRGATVSVGTFNTDVELSEPSPRQSERGIEIVASSPQRPSASQEAAGGIKSSLPNTFQGDRGGPAEDEELLAELRAISAQSSRQDRFASEEDGGQAEVSEVMPPPNPVVTSKKAPNGHSGGVPPWKRNKGKPTTSVDVDIIVEPSRPSHPEPSMGNSGGFRSSKPSTFTGERGGAAEDEELLAELRAISAGSSSADRFRGDDDTDGAQVVPEMAPPPMSAATQPKRRSAKTSKPGFLPPWKRGKDKGKAGDGTEDIIVGAPPSESPLMSQQITQGVTAGGSGGFKSSSASTFSGERGGAAEDEELLAELRAISSKSGGSNRFREEEDGAMESAPIRTGKASVPQTQGRKAATVPVVASPPRNKDEPATNPPPFMGGNIKSTLPNTFKGDRGGAAEDEELLAELRAISAGANRKDRFAEAEDSYAEQNESQQKPRNLAPSTPPPNTNFPSTNSGSMMTPTPGNEPEVIVVTRDELPVSLSDKNWKIRKESYAVLRKIVVAAGGGKGPSGAIEADSIMTGLDSLIPQLLMDKNANAVDAALQLALEYADYCQGAESAEHAAAIATSLVKGNAFTSPRPTTTKVAIALVLKLMEVGADTASLSSVIQVMLDLGLSSKKPKIVLSASNVIIEAATSFGAAVLPLAAVVSALPKMLSHSNKQIRETGLNLVAEFCRALGSKAPMNDVISKMKSAQVKELDVLLQKQPAPTPPTIVLRCHKSSPSGGNTASPGDALAVLQSGAKELEEQRFKARPAINVLDAIRNTEYADKLKLAKWSEKVAALDMVLVCGGEKPYKLLPPSGSVNYAPLVNEMKGILSHTHFAVVSKAMQVLSMLAEGVGEKLYPNLRPLLPTLLSLSKDKKLTKSVSECLDKFFGNVLSFDHILDAETALPEALDERKEKNALARTSALDFLGRCVARQGDAGPRGRLTQRAAENCSALCVNKLDDSQATVRKAALDVLKTLQKVDDSDCAQVIEDAVEGLKTSNARAYKTLSGGSKARQAPSTRASPPAPRSPKQAPPASTAESENRRHGRPTATPKPKTSAPPKNPTRPHLESGGPNLSVGGSLDVDSDEAPSIDEAVARCTTLSIPDWDSADEDGGILAGINSTKWQFRNEGIKGLASFSSHREPAGTHSDVVDDTSCILSFVKEHTRGFKETNMNVVKSILELFVALCDYHEKTRTPFPRWATIDGVSLSANKIADKKLSALSKALLSKLCIVQAPHFVLASAQSTMHKIKAPVAHEELLKWFNTFCMEFGAASIGSGLQDTITWLLEETKTTNVKVKKASISVIGTIHVQMGPVFQAIALSACKDQSLRNELEATFRDHPHDASTASADWAKVSIVDGPGTANPDGGDSKPGLQLEVPKVDLLSTISDDCITRMGSKDGKTAWKARKAAMEEVETALKRCSGLLDTSSLKPLVDLLRALKERLSDSQGNLKPVAARIIGLILATVDRSAQAKLGKVVYAPLINAAMNDSKKIMHDAAMEALQVGTSVAAIEGGGANEQALEPFIVALVGELSESEFKTAGIPAVLLLAASFTESLPDLENISAQRGESLGSKFAGVLVLCLTSSKSDTRSAAESLLQDCVKKGVISIESPKRSAGRLKPALQRSVGPVIAKLSTSPPESDDATQKLPLKADERPVEDERPKHPIGQRKVGGKPQVKGRPLVGHTKTIETSDSIPDQKDALTHPLVASVGSGGVQKSQAALRAMTWPEYPEEPSGTALFASLKKAWSPLLPAESAKALFPDRGIKKQDDAMDGCELLSRALVLERSGEGCAVVEQFGLVLKWAVFALCSKESTVGLQSLLSLFAELFNYLRESKYELSDSESLQVVPFLFDKASLAKGRFKDPFMDLIDQLKSEDLIPLKRMGPIVCVTLIESSSRAPARVMACKECSACVEHIGLSGIGKKGVLVAAKSLSEEKFPENRNALLDLIELLLSRMNSDMQRFARICGANLSGKARSMIEERLERSNTNDGLSVGTPSKSGIPPPAARVEGKLSRTTRIPNPTKSPAPVTARTVGRQRAAPMPNSNDDWDNSNSQSNFGDELPALELRFGSREGSNSGLQIRRGSSSSNYGSAGLSGSGSFEAGSAPNSPHGKPPAVFKREGSQRSFVQTMNYSFSGADDDHSASGMDEHTESEMGLTEELQASHQSRMDGQSMENNNQDSSVGAAASLRARLLRIREKNKVTVQEPGTATNPKDAPISEGQKIETYPSHTQQKVAGVVQTGDIAAENLQASQHSRREANLSPTVGADVENLDNEQAYHKTNGSTDKRREEFGKAVGKIELLLSRKAPLAEDDADLMACTNSLKTIHAAVSNQPSLAAELDEKDVAALRGIIADHTNEMVANLTRLISFGFNCHRADFHAGMSVPLLSVTLACLMALFRSDEFAKKVLQDDLTVLIREAGKALLDPRLATSSSVTEPSKLDEATSTQMVRAINKLAVQAATGATRDISLQSLLTLQLQLSLSTDIATDVFNSRLARVVTKLFARVVKAEEALDDPFSSSSLDTEAILCCLEDTLVACDEAEQTATSDEGVTATRNLARSLVMAILKARGGPGSIRSEMYQIGIKSQSSSLGNMVTLCAATTTFPESTVSSGTTSQDVASLVSALGSAQQGSEREEAIKALRRFKATHGDEELNAHLQEVSAAFRAFVLEQLSGKSTKAVAEDPAAANSMSERIKSLRSKLNATEAVVQSAVHTTGTIEPASIDSERATKVRSGIPVPSPSKIPSPPREVSNGTVAVPTSVRAFRERLAAAQEKRTSASTSDPDENVVDQPPAPSGGRAAALRARLQAVKRQSEQNS